MTMNIAPPTTTLSTTGIFTSGDDSALLRGLAADLSSQDAPRVQSALEQARALTMAQLTALLALLDDDVLELLKASLLSRGGASSSPSLAGGAPRRATPSSSPSSVAPGAGGGRSNVAPAPRGPERASGASATTPADPARGTQLAKALQRDLGLTAAQASGVVGNLMRESGLRSDVEEAGGGGGYGLAQWTGGRRDQLEAFARQRGASPGDFETQYQFLLHELRGSESGALASLRRTSTPEEAAQVFDRDFERSGVKAMSERTANARAVYERLQAGQ